MPALDFADISGWTAFGVLAMLILTGVMTGRLVPRRTHMDTIEERNLWRAASEAKDDTISELASQLRETRIVGRAVTGTLQALPRRVNDEATD